MASFTVLPKCALGTKYVAVTYPSQSSYLIIVATERFRTYVAIKITHGRSQMITLQRNSFHRIYNFNTGMSIISYNNPIAVYTVMHNAKVILLN